MFRYLRHILRQPKKWAIKQSFGPYNEGRVWSCSKCGASVETHGPRPTGGSCPKGGSHSWG